MKNNLEKEDLIKELEKSWVFNSDNQPSTLEEIKAIFYICWSLFWDFIDWILEGLTR